MLILHLYHKYTCPCLPWLGCWFPTCETFHHLLRLWCTFRCRIVAVKNMYNMISNPAHKIVVLSLMVYQNNFRRFIIFRQLTSPLKDHFASPPALANSHVKVTFLSFPSLANWSVRGCFHFCIKICVKLSMHDLVSDWSKSYYGLNTILPFHIERFYLF